MIETSNYQLVDFGNGRKLERFGEYLIDRPSPAAERFSPAEPDRWALADARFVNSHWQFNVAWPDHLALDCGEFLMPLNPRPFGHVGVFPEQAANWAWLQRQAKTFSVHRPFALNLFAYTGAGSLALATGGASIAHVDAAKPNVQAAKIAAAQSGLLDRPIRYLVDDVLSFTRRELRRGHRYSIIVLDPPSYGHDLRGNAWRIERDLWELLANLVRIAEPARAVWLITGHNPAIAFNEILDWFHHQSTLSMIDVETGAMNLTTGRRRLNAGWMLRMTTRSIDDFNR